MAEIEKSVAAAVGYRLRGGPLVEQAGQLATQRVHQADQLRPVRGRKWITSQSHVNAQMEAANDPAGARQSIEIGGHADLALAPSPPRGSKILHQGVRLG